jgi:Sulfotransferase family
MPQRSNHPSVPETPGPADQMTAQPPLIVFVHVPKTAGTTFTEVLRLNEPGKRNLRAANVFKAGSGGAKTGAEYLRLRREGAFDGVRLITGHFPLAVREHLPQDRELRCCTILRDPIERTISHYFNIREASARRSGDKAWALAPLPEDASLDDALERGYLYDNLQTRMLSGVDRPFGEVTEEMLERAKHNLSEELVVFGLAERLDESLLLAKRRLGLTTVLARWRPRINEKRPRGNAIPDDMRESARRANAQDIELYRYAQELFDETPELAEPAFQVEAAAIVAARADGDIDLAVPPPAAYHGDEASWRLLLQATAGSMRLERELAEVRAMAGDVTARGNEALEHLAQMPPHELKPRWNGIATQAVSELLELLGSSAQRARESALPGDDQTDGPSVGRRKPRAGKQLRRRTKRSETRHVGDAN